MKRYNIYYNKYNILARDYVSYIKVVLFPFKKANFKKLYFSLKKPFKNGRRI